MSFKDSIQGRLEKLADDVVPKVLGTWKDVQKRLDDLNCSLANRAVPERRRSKVSELSLRQKAEEAGQGGSKLKVVKSSRKVAAK